MDSNLVVRVMFIVDADFGIDPNSLLFAWIAPIFDEKSVIQHLIMMASVSFSYSLEQSSIHYTLSMAEVA